MKTLKIKSILTITLFTIIAFLLSSCKKETGITEEEADGKRFSTISKNIQKQISD